MHRVADQWHGTTKRGPCVPPDDGAGKVEQHFGSAAGTVRRRSFVGISPLSLVLLDLVLNLCLFCCCFVCVLYFVVVDRFGDLERLRHDKAGTYLRQRWSSSKEHHRHCMALVEECRDALSAASMTVSLKSF